MNKFELRHLILLTYDGVGMSVARRLQQEGVTVTVAQIRDKKDILTSSEQDDFEDETDRNRRLQTYEGILDVHDVREVIAAMQNVKDKSGFFVMTDFNHCFKYAQEFEKMGIPGNYPTEEDRTFEVDRDKFKDFVAKNYADPVKVAPKQVFKTVADGIAFLEENSEDAKWALKGYDEDSKTYVPHETDESLAMEGVVEMLNSYKDEYERAGFLLEQVIEKPIELTPEVYFWNGEPVWATIDIELKRMGAGDYGAMTGCAANLVFQVELESPIIQMILPEAVLEMFKNKKGWGIWDTGLLWDGETAYASEGCPNRLGWDAFVTELSMFPSAKEFFEALVNRDSLYDLSENPFAMAVRVFNFNPDKGAIRGIKARWKEEVDRNVFPMDIKKDENGEIVTGGYSKDFVVITGAGDSVEMAVEECYRNLEGFGIGNGMVRPKSDILSYEYPTSIMRRYDFGNDWIWES